MMGFGRVFAVLAPFIAAYLLGAGLSRPALYQLFGVVMLVSGVAVYSLHRTYIGANAMDAMQEETKAAEERVTVAAACAEPGAAGERQFRASALASRVTT